MIIFYMTKNRRKSTESDEVAMETVPEMGVDPQKQCLSLCRHDFWELDDHFEA